ncbi:MAG: haloacid dehalogenase type II, partial [Acidimicrobiia bacterium]
MDATSIKALTFDVFGTVVDWRTSIIRQGREFGETRELKLDWEAFADAWRQLYQPTMERVRSGELPWARLDDLHRMSLDQLIAEFAITGLAESEIDNLNRAWHRLDPWPDSVAGLTRLRSRFVLATLSNGNVALMVNLARHAGLPWDAILGAEPAQHYKPHPEAYLRTAGFLGIRPDELML